MLRISNLRLHDDFIKPPGLDVVESCSGTATRVTRWSRVGWGFGCVIREFPPLFSFFAFAAPLVQIHYHGLDAFRKRVFLSFDCRLCSSYRIVSSVCLRFPVNVWSLKAVFDRFVPCRSVVLFIFSFGTTQNRERLGTCPPRFLCPLSLTVMRLFVFTSFGLVSLDLVSFDRPSFFRSFFHSVSRRSLLAECLGLDGLACSFRSGQSMSKGKRNSHGDIEKTDRHRIEMSEKRACAEAATGWRLRPLHVRQASPVFCTASSGLCGHPLDLSWLFFPGEGHSGSFIVVVTRSKR